MNTKPKAMKFRIRRSASPVAPAAGSPEAAASAPRPALRPVPDPAAQRVADVPAAPPAAGPPPAAAPKIGDLSQTFMPAGDGFGSEPFRTARGTPDTPPAAPAPAADADPAAPDALPEGDSDPEIEAIRSEGLTGRQLRMARRVAQKHNLTTSSDFDAVRQLRKRGIDPFERGNLLELVTASPGGQDQATGNALAPRAPGLPQTRPGPQLPGAPAPRTLPGALDEAGRAREVLRIQRDIARRRRRRLALLFVRLSIFVLLPTLLGGIYYARMATPLYATHSEFLIQKADSGGSSGGGLGGLLGSSGLGGATDSITVQSYLTSRDAMLRLDAEEGFRAHFSQEWIDPIKRLPPGASNEQAYRLYTKNIVIGFDPTEGIIRMEVVAADPATSERFAHALVRYAEEQVDHLSARMRSDRMAGAQESFEEAEKKMLAAQARVLELQEQLGVLDPTAESSALMGEISQREAEMRQKQLELQGLLDNARPNQARVDGLRADISRIEAMVTDLRSRLTQSGLERNSMAQIAGQLQIAQSDLLTRQAMMTAALEQLELARVEANKQVRYLALGVRPVAPDEATYPKVFENTLLVFFIFSGIYLMISLTVSILKEQVSA